MNSNVIDFEIVGPSMIPIRIRDCGLLHHLWKSSRLVRYYQRIAAAVLSREDQTMIRLHGGLSGHWLYLSFLVQQRMLDERIPCNIFPHRLIKDLKHSICNRYSEY